MRIRACTLHFVFLIVFLKYIPSVAQTVRSESPAVTAVSGESWLVHLNRTFDETSMGKTGRVGPPELVSGKNAAVSAAGMVADSSNTVILSGADMYRLNCRGCHGESGEGAPPEINSVINPVRASSVAAVMARMKSAGAEVSRSDAIKLAEQSKVMLLQRLHNGGQDMPAFPQLSAADIKVLMGYLKQLAEVPGSANEHGVVKASPQRVGELIVKSTCHTCHGATGENPSPQELADGAIPPLNTLTSRVSRVAFVRKVTQGAPIVMGSPALTYRGRMPVFYYLSEEEASDVYEYLLNYPPAPEVAAAPVAALSTIAGVAGRSDPPGGSGKSTAASNEDIAMESSIVLPVAGLLVIVLLGGGAALTVIEMRKLAGPGGRRERVVKDAAPATVRSMQGDLVA